MFSLQTDTCVCIFQKPPIILYPGFPVSGQLNLHSSHHNILRQLQGVQELFTFLYGILPDILFEILLHSRVYSGMGGKMNEKSMKNVFQFPEADTLYISRMSNKKHLSRKCMRLIEHKCS